MTHRHAQEELERGTSPEPRVVGEPTRSYVVTFDRIGRHHDVLPLRVQAVGPGTFDILADAVLRYARPKLGSRDVTVAIDLEAMSGFVLCGVQNGGRFTLAAAE